MQTRIATGREATYDDVGQGPILVLLHGPLLNRRMWQPQFEALAKDYRLLAPDLPTPPLSDDGGETTSVEAMADDLAALLDALEVCEPVVLVGISLGGNIALTFARKYASRLRGLVLADTGGGINASEETRLMYDRMIDFLRSQSIRDAVELLLPRLLSPTAVVQQPALAQRVRDLASGLATTATCRLLQAVRDAPVGLPALAATPPPMLVIVGTADGLAPPPVAEKLAAALGASLVRILGAGHLSNLERPEAFNQALRSFMDILEAPS
jgi:pimeloyl-ACP methyl ester carboxylesterase